MRLIARQWRILADFPTPTGYIAGGGTTSSAGQAERVAERLRALA